MKASSIIIGLLVVIVVVLIALRFLPENSQPAPVTNNGNAAEVADRIVVTSPKPNETISNPLVITGEARGTWFFEASFPVVLYAENGPETGIGGTIATADGDWMTEDFVPFTATLNYSGTDISGPGTLVLMRDNPSGLPENDAELRIPVIIE